MENIFCKIFGHSWRYLFTTSDFYNKETNIRICRFCGKVQHHKQIPSLKREGEWVWMNMIGYTKLGAKKRWNKSEIE